MRPGVCNLLVHSRQDSPRCTERHNKMGSSLVRSANTPPLSSETWLTSSAAYLQSLASSLSFPRRRSPEHCAANGHTCWGKLRGCVPADAIEVRVRSSVSPRLARVWRQLFVRPHRTQAIFRSSFQPRLLPYAPSVAAVRRMSVANGQLRTAYQAHAATRWPPSKVGAGSSRVRARVSNATMKQGRPRSGITSSTCSASWVAKGCGRSRPFRAVLQRSDAWSRSTHIPLRAAPNSSTQ